MNVRYSKGAREDRGEREERVVDIYESINLPMQDGGEHIQKLLPAVQRNPFRTAALVLGLLCILLLAGIAVLSKLYITVILEKEKLIIINDQLNNRFYNLRNKTYCQTEGWRLFGCSCYYISTNMKSWNDSRTDCEKRGAKLVIINNREEQDFLTQMNKHETSWIGLESKKRPTWSDEWEWKWVDGSKLQYQGWSVGVSVTPVNRSTAYISLQGTWMYTNNGSKQWICEKQIKELSW
ncbi:CD209 antigen-like protein E isoform X1 [Lates japonicus]|uniref:CD209 antigen-like protein E isoform X1 n=1 Tax=Lates japonicus TaxID=270547 RepID=A0AAD3NLL9_LATJO|nr:CD209 antigen-like protein E isoform X1 [Lates japonicus]